jgi:hypothetical protein
VVVWVSDDHEGYRNDLSRRGRYLREIARQLDLPLPTEEAVSPEEAALMLGTVPSVVIRRPMSSHA